MSELTTSCELCDYPSTVRVHDGCQRRLDEHLASIPGLYAALGAFTAPVRRPGGTQGPKAVDAPLPLNLDVLDLRARGGFERLTDWEADTRSLLGWSPVPFRGSIEQTVTGAVKFLRNNLLWLCDQHPAVRDFDAEVRHMVSAALSIVNPPEPSRRLGYCPTIDESGVICGAVLRLGEGESTARCRWCGTSWAPDRWAELALAQCKFEAEPVASNPGVRVG